MLSRPPRPGISPPDLKTQPAANKSSGLKHKSGGPVGRALNDSVVGVILDTLDLTIGAGDRASLQEHLSSSRK